MCWRNLGIERIRVKQGVGWDLEKPRNKRVRKCKKGNGGGKLVRKICRRKERWGEKMPLFWVKKGEREEMRGWKSELEVGKGNQTRVKKRNGD